jgi:hypothetical protein
MPSPPDLVAHKPHFHRNEAWKQPVRCATAAAGTLASSFEDGDSAGGVTLATGDRILVKDQAAAEENGIYVVAASGAPARAYDMDVDAEVVGAMVPVIDGTHAGTVWRCTNTATPTLGVTDLVWAAWPSAAGGTAAIEYVVDGAGAELTGGLKGFLEIPFDCTITAGRLLADTAGGAIVDVWNDTYSAFPPTNADSITAAAPLTMAAAAKSEDVTLTGWTTGIDAGDILAFNIDSVSTVTRLTISLTVERV